MKNLPETFKDNLESEVTHLCRCWQITRRDGVHLGLTDHNNALRFNNILFHANAGMNVTAIEQRSGLSAHGLDVKGVIGSPYLAAEDLQKGLYDHARLQIFLVDWQNPENHLLLISGIFAEVTIEQGAFQVSLKTVMSHLQNQKGRVYQRSCDTALGDKRCGIDLSQDKFQAKRQIRALDNTQLTFDNLPHQAGWFGQGKIILASGQAIDIREDSQKDNQRIIVLWQAPPANIKPGDEVTLQAGCDKQFSTCKTKFANQINFQGFPHLPTETTLISVAGL